MKGGRKRGRDTSMCGCLSHAGDLQGTWPTTQACALTGNRTGNPLVHRLALNPLSHTSQGCLDTILMTRNVGMNKPSSLCLWSLYSSDGEHSYIYTHGTIFHTVSRYANL